MNGQSTFAYHLRRLLPYSVALVLLALMAPVLNRIGWRGHQDLHTAFEVVATVLALIVGYLAWVYHKQSQRSAYFLFIGVGFLGTGLFDGIHFLLTSDILQANLPSPLIEVAPWSWLISRFFLGGFLLLNALTLSHRAADEFSSPHRIWWMFVLTSALAALTLAVFLLSPLPQAVYSSQVVNRPQEVVVAIPYLLAFAIYFWKQARRFDAVYHWVKWSILVNIGLQLCLMAWSQSLYDPLFNWAHLAKIISYALVLMGLASSMAHIVRQLRVKQDEIESHLRALEAEVARREKAEASIRIYQNIVDTMHSGVMVLRLEDADDPGSFRMILGNRGAQLANGMPLSQLVGKRIDEALPSTLTTHVPELCRQVLINQKSQSLKEFYFKGDGIEGYFDSWIVPLDEQHICTIFENVTERKLAADALRRSEQELAEAQRLAHLGSWVWDISADVVTWSDELYRIYGHEPRAIRLDLQSYLGHIHPEDRELVENTVRHSMATGASFDYYHRIITTKGVTRILQARGHVAVQTNEDGVAYPVRMWGTAQDVTEQRQADEARRRNELRLSQAQRLAQIGHWDWDFASDQVVISTELAQIFGYTEGAVSLNYADFLSLVCLEDRPGVREAIDLARTETGSFQAEFRITRPDGVERGVHAIGAVVQTEAGLPVGMWGTGQDITERLALEAKLKSYTASLEASNRELQNFAYIASHDLQEPLRKINAFSDRLATLNRAVLDDRSLDYLRRMQDAVRRMQILINDLLTLSRVSTQGNPFGPVNLNQIVRTVLADLEVRIEESQGRVEVAPLPDVIADDVQMHQLFQNLIGNSLKFHEAQCPPVVRVYSTSERLGSNGSGTPEMVTIVVEDNGIGFDEQYKEKIFQPFQRLHGRSAYEGTGMGLAICRRILERHGGTIQAESSPDQGTRIIFTLPRSQSRGTKADPSAQPEALPAAQESPHPTPA